jgi:outer membrane biosynthesis protein TonB
MLEFIKENRGISFSFVLHASFLLLAVFGLPMWHTPLETQQRVRVVELLPLADRSNVKNRTTAKPVTPPEEVQSKEVKKQAAEAPAKTQEIEKPNVEQPVPPQPEQKPNEQLVSPKPVEKKIEKTEEPKPKAKSDQAKPKPTEKEKKKLQKNISNSVDDIMKNLEEASSEVKNDKVKAKKKVIQVDQLISEMAEHDTEGPFDPNSPEALQLSDLIGSMIEQCWKFESGGRDLSQVIIRVRMNLGPDGAVVQRQLVGVKGAEGLDASVKEQLVRSTLRAIEFCSPYDKLPANQHRIWKEVTVNFSPPI